MKFLVITFLALILVTSGCTTVTEVEDWRITEHNVNRTKAPQSSQKLDNPDLQSAKNEKLSMFVNFPDSSKIMTPANPKTLKTLPAKEYTSFSPPKFVAMGLLSFYRSVLTHGIKTSCPFCITCSAYSVRALKEYGLVLGYIMTIDRLLRCNRSAGDKYFIRSKPGKSSQRSLCLLDEPANNNIFNRKERKK